MEKKPLALTIVIPFCPNKCGFCDHTVHTGASSATKEAYVRAVCKEAECVAPEMDDYEVTSVCVRGGELCGLGGSLLKELLSTIRHSFSLADSCEYVLHMNPENLTLNIVKNLKEAIGPGTEETPGSSPSLRFQFEQETMDPILRTGLKPYYSLRSLDAALTLLEEHPEFDFGINLLYGLQGQNIPQLRAALCICQEYNASFVSLSPLRLTPGTFVAEEYAKHAKEVSTLPRFQFPSPQKQQAMFEDALKQLKERGYEQVTWNDCAKAGLSSRYLSDYVSAVDELGLGLGAASHFDGAHYQNTSSLPLYLTHSADYETILVNAGPVSTEEEARRVLSRALLSPKGLSVSAFTSRFGLSPEQASLSQLETWKKDGLAVQEEDTLRLTLSGAAKCREVLSALQIV